MIKKISVIIPCYNQIHTLKEIITRIQNVDPKSLFEIIVVDDFSDDGSRDLLQKDFSLKISKLILNNKNNDSNKNKFNNLPKKKIFFLKEDKLELILDLNIIKQIACNDPESCTNINIFLDQIFYKDKNYYLYDLKYE